MAYTPEDAGWFAALGARVTTEPSTPTHYSAEVHLAEALDFMGEPDPEDPEHVIDIRSRVLLEHFRVRDGYSWPARPE